MADTNTRKPNATPDQIKAAQPALYYGMLLIKDKAIAKNGKPYQKITLAIEVTPEGYKEPLNGYIEWVLWDEQVEKYGTRLKPFEKQRGWVLVSGLSINSYKGTDGQVHESSQAKRFGFMFWNDLMDVAAQLDAMYTTIFETQAQLAELQQHLAAAPPPAEPVAASTPAPRRAPATSYV